MSKRSLSEIEHEHILGPWSYQKSYFPGVIKDVDDCYFVDEQGKRYLDFRSQVVCANLGNRNEAVINAIRQQAATIPFVSSKFTTQSRAELGSLLADVTPKSLEKTFFSTSGTEANEAVIKISRLYTGKSKIISRYRSYHGSTAGSMSVSGDPRRHCIEPDGLMPGVIRAPDPYCYRCPLKQEYPDCGIACVDYIDYIIEMESNEKIAAVLVEAIVGSSGAVIVPPNEYLPRLRDITRNAGILLAIDEVMTGFGRTGEWFATNHYNVTPDLMSMAKGLTGSYVPMGATIMTQEIASHFDEDYFCVGHTFSGHPLAAAAALAALKEYKERKLIENARTLGKVMEKRLNELKDKHACIGDVRGKGLFWAIELVKNRKTKEPFVRRQEYPTKRKHVFSAVASEALKKGLFIGGLPFTNSFLLTPPLVISEAEIDVAMEVLDGVLKLADAETE